MLVATYPCGGPGDVQAGGGAVAVGQARMAASAADRDRAIKLLQESFIEGRLARDELEQRVGQALVSRDFRELLTLTADLPVRSPFDRMPAHRITPRPPVRGRRSRRWLVRVVARLASARARQPLRRQ
jgi:hypothetical protein